MRHQCLSPRYGSDQQPDLAQGTVCLMESQRARIRVSELVWYRIFRVAWLAWVAVREAQKYMSVVGGGFVLIQARGKYLDRAHYWNGNP